MALLPCPFTGEDEDADYCWQLSVLQAEFSTDPGAGPPATGRIFFEQLIRDNSTSAARTRSDIIFARQDPPATARPRATPGTGSAPG